jgi:hypothetical protein
MYYSCFSPAWFFGTDVAFQVVFAAVAALIAGLAFHIHRRSSQKRPLYLGIGFGFISASYFLQALLNILIVAEVLNGFCQNLNHGIIIATSMIAVLIHMLLMVTGLCIMIYATFKNRNHTALFLILFLSTFTILMSRNTLYAFFWVSAVLLISLFGHFLKNYWQKKKRSSLLIALAFLFIFLGMLDFGLVQRHYAFYVTSHLLELLGYGLIAVNFYQIIKNGKKTRSS